MNLKFKENSPDIFILDLDGVFTDGKFAYSKMGKISKSFGPDDHDILKFLKNYLKIHVVTADSKGFEISHRRLMVDMNLTLNLVSAEERLNWIDERFDVKKTIYMGDGLLDILVFREVMYSITPANALDCTKNEASFITKSSGGDRAVAEASLHILDKFFGIDLNDFLSKFQS